MTNLTASDIQRLRTQAEEIRYETREAFNTAERVGAMFIALIEALRLFEDLTDKFLKKHEEDTADEVITFLKGIICGAFDENLGGAKIDENGDAGFNKLTARDEAIFREALSSPDFISGFLDGKGWSIFKESVLNALGIPETKYTLEIDNLVVRGMLRIFEMVVSQLLGENDNRVFTAMLEVDHYDPETGIVWLDTQGGKFYNPFRKDDYIMVQQFNGMPSEENGYYVTKSYELIITETGIGNLSDDDKRLDWVKFKSFTSQMDGATAEDLITKGDTFVRVDNASDPDRKGLIQITTVGSKTPYMDVAYGMKTDPDNYLKGRLGNLEGIRHHLFGWLQGFGEYLNNLYAVGDFRLRRTGESLDTLVEVLKDRFSSIYSSFMYDITEDDNYLYNPSFTQNMDGWEPIIDDAMLISLPGEEAFLMNGNLMIADSRKACLTNYEGTKMLYLYDSGVTQENSLIRKPGTHKVYDDSKGVATDWESSVADEIDGDYKEEKDTLYLFIKFLAKTSGNLTIGFKGASSEEGSLPNPVTVFVDSSEEWQLMEWIGTWDGNGYFILEYTGEMYVSQLSLTSEPLDDFKSQIGTQILQTERNIQLLGYNIDAKTGRILDLGISLDVVEGQIKLWAEETFPELQEGVAWSKAQITIESGRIDNLVEDLYIDVDGKSVTRVSQLEITSQQIQSTVSRIENGDYPEGEEPKLWTQVTQTAEDITSLVEEVYYDDKGEKKSRFSKIEQEIDKITQEVYDEDGQSRITQTAHDLSIYVEDNDGRVAKIEEDAENLRLSVEDLEDGFAEIELTATSLTQRVGNLEGDYVLIDARITEQGAALDLKVGYNEVISSINMSPEEILIDAKRVKIAGDFTVNNVFNVTKDGQITLSGILRFSTAYQGNISDYQIFYFGDTDRARDLSMGSEHEDVGKVVWFYNKSQYTHRIFGCQFNVSGGGRVDDTYGYAIGPQEAMQMTCFQISETRAEWIMTQRLSYQQFRGDNYNGRYPLLWGMGTMTVNPTDWSVRISGNRYDGTALNGLISVERTDYGNYKFTFASGTLPANYFIMCQPLTMYDTWRNAKENISASVTVVSKSATEIVFACSDDESSNDCSFDFMIYDTSNWYYAK